MSSEGAHQELSIQYSHIQLYIDHLQPLDYYKAYEDAVNKFHHEYDSQKSNDKQTGLDVAKGKEIWNTIIAQTSSPCPAEEEYHSHGREVIKQLIAGFGFRITGCAPSGTVEGMKSVLVTSSDERGIQIVVSARGGGGAAVGGTGYAHFDAGK
jgi:hypothetical protein